MIYDEMTTRERKRAGIAVSELVKVGATPDEIERRAVIYRTRYTASLTPSAMASQWSMLRDAPEVLPASRRPSAVDEGIQAAKARLAAEQVASNVIPMKERNRETGAC